jgi:hypothetical protein
VIVLLWACTHRDPAETDAVDCADDDLVLAETDFDVGALATIDADSRVVHDALASVPSDPAVVVDGGLVIVLGGRGFDVVRLHTPCEWDAPKVEFSLEDDANPHDAAICAGALFVTQYGLPRLGVYDLDGEHLADVDLSDYADADGIPEADRVVRVDDTLYVALNRLDEVGASWPAAGPGMVVEVDCASRAVTAAWETGPNPTAYAIPGDPGRLVLRVGTYYQADAVTLNLDGGLEAIDLASGEVSPLFVDEADLGQNVTGFAAMDAEHGLFLSQDPGSVFHVWTVDPTTGSTAEIGDSTAFLTDVEAIGPEAWIAAGQSWEDPEARTGLLVADLVSGEMVVTTPIPTALPPVSLAALP